MLDRRIEGCGLDWRLSSHGIIANLLLKLTLVLTIGSASFRPLASLGLGVLTLVSAAALLTFW